MATRTRNVSVSGFYNPRSSRLCRDKALVLPQLHLLHCPVLLLGQTQASPGAVCGHSSVSQGVRSQEYDHQSKVTRQQWEHPATTSNQPPVSPAVRRHALSQSSSSLDFHWRQVHQAGGSLPPTAGNPCMISAMGPANQAAGPACWQGPAGLSSPHRSPPQLNSLCSALQ